MTRIPTGRWRVVAPTVVFDIAAPLAIYYGLKASGMSDVPALVISGVPPAMRVVGSAVRDRRVDAVGVVVVIGIVVGSIVGLISGSARLLLLEGVVPTAVFGLVCLGSLATSRPMMFRFALTFLGPETDRGREFADLWRYERFRHVLRVITIVWGTAYLVEAAVKAVIVETISISAAKAVSQILPFVVLIPLIAWNVAYGRRSKAEGDRLLAEARLRGDVPPPMPAR